MKFLISHGQAIRSVFGRSLVTHFISFSFRRLRRSRRLPTEQQCALAVLVETVEEWPRESEQLFVVADHREAAHEPGAGSAVDVAVATGRPPHATGSSTSSASSSTASCAS